MFVCVCVCVCVGRRPCSISITRTMPALMRNGLSRLLVILKLRTKKTGPLSVTSYVKSRIIWRTYRVAILRQGREAVTQKPPEIGSQQQCPSDTYSSQQQCPSDIYTASTLQTKVGKILTKQQFRNDCGVSNTA